ncbi:MAG: elongation factor G [Thalassospira sp.]|uniref:elongation factor G n=1 Tax=Thalassospira sp. 11-3 TaxID=2135614 RepID=UPI000D751CBB|nr:elongation factor G [Thalassospira sp. 11-3]MBL4840226.1 elongation factor G [Thalassospira sp.]PXX30909.1 translation elongation factor 2 (EF-2/EF-G) [Thalassospira sp. 11-3]
MPPSKDTKDKDDATNPASGPRHVPRCAALIGPYSSGKTSLFESLLAATGRVHRKGSIRDGTTIGDATAEARERHMSTEMTVAQTRYLDEEWHFIDCPGSVDFAQDAREAAMICDVAIVVVEPDPTRAMIAAPTLKFLDRNRIPHLIFINKTDHGGIRLRDSLDALQSISERPLVLREIPIRDGKGPDDTITGFVDVVSERAYQYLEGQPSKLITLPANAKDRETEVRDGLLEALADFDDNLLEQILEDQKPATATIYDNLERDLAKDLIVPVFFGSAEHDHGIIRLLKALRHEAPNADVCAHRLGIEPEDNVAAAQIFKTVHLPHAGRFCYGRVLSGQLKNGDTLGRDKVAGMCQVFGDKHEKLDIGTFGSIIGLPRIDHLRTGSLCTTDGEMDNLWPDPLPPLYETGLEVTKPGDDVKLTEALRHLCEQDRSLSFIHSDNTGQLVLRGHGDIHLQVALAQLRSRYHLEIETRPVETAYQETVRKPAQARGRYKKQTGGHGQFGDAQIEVKPLGRGEGFSFTERIVGGAIPRQYIPAVEKGVRDATRSGPLGFPVVDIAVELVDGSYHAVDSSDQAFQMAGRIAIAEALKEGQSVLLEPIERYAISIPSEFTSKAQRLVSTRRGQILGFSAKDDWQGWDEIDVQMPASETGNMVMELRSLTQGTGFFTRSFSHMQEIAGKQADMIVSTREKPHKK